MDNDFAPDVFERPSFEPAPWGPTWFRVVLVEYGQCLVWVDMPGWAEKVYGRCARVFAPDGAAWGA